MSRPSTLDPHPRHRVTVLETDIAYAEVGSGHPIVFLHGNPTSSYLWRNVISEVKEAGRCLAPDLVGMGQSGPAPGGSYRFVDHARYLDAWFDAVVPRERVVLVGHDWGSALAFYWARRYPERIRGLVYMEALVTPLRWEDWPESGRSIFQAMRSPAGEDMVLTKNVFVERILPASVLRSLTDEEMAAYRAPYLQPGEGRRPTLQWPREIPIDGQPADVAEIVDDSCQWLGEAHALPKLFINAEPGVILVGRQREACRRWPHQQEVTVAGLHFVQEDSPVEIGRALTRFVSDLA